MRRTMRCEVAMHECCNPTQLPRQISNVFIFWICLFHLSAGSEHVGGESSIVHLPFRLARFFNPCFSRFINKTLHMSWNVEQIVVSPMAADCGEWVRPVVTPLTPEQGLPLGCLPLSFGSGIPGAAVTPMLPVSFDKNSHTRTPYGTFQLSYGGYPGRGLWIIRD